MKYILDAERMKTKMEAHEYLAEVFGFPEHYGKNLDALHDCLSELENLEVEVENLSEENCGTYVRHVLRVLKESRE